ncbi:hypothetical protein LENED_002423 [Lentinula edodes]|uniref:Uncharacterized protein n=1 Tax=Lentinula edodes TaxID=5353 RepID=A0A1Q3E1G9_LENED|nr:hypothetical protein LENED_002423 [Lentinula edodes]
MNRALNSLQLHCLRRTYRERSFRNVHPVIGNNIILCNRALKWVCSSDENIFRRAGFSFVIGKGRKTSGELISTGGALEHLKKDVRKVPRSSLALTE